MLEIIAAATLVTVCLGSVAFILQWTAKWSKFQCNFNAELHMAERKRSDELEKKLVLVSWENCKQYTDARESYERDVLQRISNLYQRMQDAPVTLKVSPAAPPDDVNADSPQGENGLESETAEVIADNLLDNVPLKDVQAWAKQFGIPYDEMKDLAQRAANGTLTENDTERYQGQVPDFIEQYLPSLDENLE